MKPTTELLEAILFVVLEAPFAYFILRVVYGKKHSLWTYLYVYFLLWLYTQMITNIRLHGIDV